MHNIRIITDSAADYLTCKRDDITVLPIPINFGDCEYLDGKTMDHHSFYKKLMESDSLPTTSLITPHTFAQEFQKAEKLEEQIIVITLSQKLSGIYQSAKLAAEEYSDRVFVVDSNNATIGERILVEYAAALIDRGFTAGEITEKLEQQKTKIKLFALLDTLDYLKKGGRIPKSVALIGGVLSIKPVVAIQNGEVAMLGKARGIKNGFGQLVQQVLKTNGMDLEKPFCFGCTGLDNSMLKLFIQESQALWADAPKPLPFATVGATIGTHVGPNAIAVAYFEKETN